MGGFYSNRNFVEKEVLPKEYIFICFSLLLGSIALFNNCQFIQLDENTYEIKNVATYEKEQGKGYGSLMMKHIIENYKDKCDTLLVGTGDDNKTLSFYKKYGFVYSHTVKNFFIDNYDHEMFENGQQLIDMIYLKTNVSK